MGLFVAAAAAAVIGGGGDGSGDSGVCVLLGVPWPCTSCTTVL